VGMARKAHGIMCPKCGAPMYTCDSRQGRNNSVYRRKVCKKCGTRVATREYQVGELEAIVYSGGGKQLLNSAENIVAAAEKLRADIAAIIAVSNLTKSSER